MRVAPCIHRLAAQTAANRRALRSAGDFAFSQEQLGPFVSRAQVLVHADESCLIARPDGFLEHFLPPARAQATELTLRTSADTHALATVEHKSPPRAEPSSPTDSPQCGGTTGTTIDSEQQSPAVDDDCTRIYAWDAVPLTFNASRLPGRPTCETWF